jgi:hypothetical protein
VDLTTAIDPQMEPGDAALMLLFALISIAPVTIIPRLPAAVAAIGLLLVTQMIAGRLFLWLPKSISRRRLSTNKLGPSF